MFTRPKSLRRAAARVFEPLAALPVLAILHGYGLIGHAPLWLMMALLFAAAVLQQPEIQRKLAGGDTPRYLHRAIALQFCLVGLMLYLTGWGPLLSIVFPIGAAMYLRTFGSVAWRPVLIWTVVAITAGQLGVGLGWLYCYLSPTLAQVAGILGGQTGLFFIRALGMSVEQRERAQVELSRREERFRALVQDTSDVVSIIDRTGRTLYVGPGVEHLTGLQPEEFLETEFRHWLHPDDHARAAKAFAQALADSDGEHRTELRLRQTNGDVRWIELTLRNLLDNPAVGGLVATYRDITERRAIQERLTHDAHSDPLTGLSNRAAFLHALEKCLLEGEPGTPAVLFLDLDHFKLVNDTYGHQAGDKLIIAVAAMLRRSVLGSDIVGRLGGDEFGIVLTNIKSTDDAVTVAKRILAEMDQPVLISGQKVYARASIGVAVADSGNVDADELLHHADIAMYGAKRRQSHTYRLYAGGRRVSTDHAVTLDEELRTVVDNGEHDRITRGS